MLLGCDILVFWQYERRGGWIRYPAANRGAATREAFLIQCVHSEKYHMFHCEPTIDWPIEK